MRAFQRSSIGSAVAAAFGAFATSLAAPELSVASSDGEVLVMQMVKVTGVLELAAQPAGDETALEIDSGAMGRYRIDESGLGAELVRHVGELVTVVAVVSPSAADGRQSLRVERFTLHEG